MPLLRGPTIQAAATAGILEYIESGGGNASWVVREADLTREDLSSPENRLPLRNFVTLIEAASRSTGDDCFGAHLGEVCSLRANGLPGYLATFAPTVNEALSAFARYYYLLGDATVVRFESRGDVSTFTYRVLDPESWPRRQDAEQLITMIVFLLREWIGSHFRPLRVYFEHARPARADELERIFGCPVSFEAEDNAVVFEQRFAAHRNPTADEKLFRLLSWFSERVTGGELPPSDRTTGFRERVLESIDACSHLGNASVHSVSRALGLEARTLQRRLQADATSFRELHEEYQRREAVKLLQSFDHSEKEIASRLGYANLNSFIRAFRRWYRVTPGQFRERPLGRGRP
jgi:AraC-like DNA-binding protein